jgi:hypothetical protein
MGKPDGRGVKILGSKWRPVPRQWRFPGVCRPTLRVAHLPGLERFQLVGAAQADFLLDPAGALVTWRTRPSRVLVGRFPLSSSLACGRVCPVRVRLGHSATSARCPVLCTLQEAIRMRPFPFGQTQAAPKNALPPRIVSEKGTMDTSLLLVEVC